MLGTGRKDSAGIEHRFREGNRGKRREQGEEEEEEEENRLSATIVTGRGFASRLVDRGLFNRCFCSIGPRYTTDSFCYRGFHPAVETFWADRRSPLSFTSPPSSEAGARNTNARGLAKGRARKSFTNLASCQEQEDLAHPFLSLSPEEKERERERVILDARRRTAKQGARESWQSFSSGKKKCRRRIFLRPSPTRLVLFFYFF